MRRLEQLINQARRQSENLSFDDATGISDEEFVQYANNGQNRIQSLIAVSNDEIFQKEKIIDAVKDQESYDLPDDTLLTTRLQNVEFSDDGGTTYYPLSQGTLKQRIATNVNSNIPSFYIRRSSEILIQPSPVFGKIRINYQFLLPRLDIRRAEVKSSTLNTNSRTITDLFLDTTKNIDQTEIQDEGYMTVVDKDGNIKMKAIPVQSINSSTGEVAVYSGFVYEEGETISSGDFVVLGKNTSTHSSLPQICERYLIEFMVWKILKRDSSGDSSEQNNELKEMEADIIASFSEADQDIDFVPIINNYFTHFDDDDWY